MTTQTLDIDRINRELEVLSPQEILAWALREHPGQVFTTTSFQISGMVLLHMIKDLAPETPILFIDTLHHFQKTLDFKDRIVSEWGLNVIELKRDISWPVFRRRYGEKLFDRDPELCCQIHKVEPIHRAIRENPDYKCWIAGLRRDQSRIRSGIRIVEDSGGVLKVHPLANTTRDQVEWYLEKHKIPHNPLFDEGYLSIGCSPNCCTRPPRDGRPGANERTQRWSGSMKDECGLHTFLKEPSEIHRAENI